MHIYDTKRTKQMFLPGEQNRYVMVQGVFVPLHVKLLLPFAETVQTVISMVCNLQLILPSTRRREMKGRKREVNKLKNWQLVDYMCAKRSNTNTGSV